MRFPGTAFFCGAMLLAGCAQEPAVVPTRWEPGRVDGENALKEVQMLVALGLRDSGTEGARVAADHLKARLEVYGVETQIDAFEDDSPRGRITFRNVVGRLPGTGSGLIILGSHYDTKTGMGEGFEGANDSGSSTGLLLELARTLAAGTRPSPEIWFAFFDGEESMKRYGPHDGFHGSLRMAHQLAESGRAEEVRAMILLDMIGDKDLTVTIPRNSSPELVSLVFAAAGEEDVRSKFSYHRYQIGGESRCRCSAGR